MTEGSLAVTSVPEELQDAIELIACSLDEGLAAFPFGFFSGALVPARDNFCGDFEVVDDDMNRAKISQER